MPSHCVISSTGVTVSLSLCLMLWVSVLRFFVTAAVALGLSVLSAETAVRILEWIYEWLKRWFRWILFGILFVCFIILYAIWVLQEVDLVEGLVNTTVVAAQDTALFVWEATTARACDKFRIIPRSWCPQMPSVSSNATTAA